MASINNNCNVFTSGRSTDLSCEVAVLTLNFGREYNITEKVGGEDERKVFSILFYFYETSSLTIHHNVHPWHGHRHDNMKIGLISYNLHIIRYYI